MEEELLYVLCGNLLEVEVGIKLEVLLLYVVQGGLMEVVEEVDAEV